MTDYTDIRPAGTEPGPGDLDEYGCIWIFTYPTWTNGIQWLHVSAGKPTLFWRRFPWLPGWAIPIPSSTKSDD